MTSITLFLMRDRNVLSISFSIFLFFNYYFNLNLNLYFFQQQQQRSSKIAHTAATRPRSTGLYSLIALFPPSR